MNDFFYDSPRPIYIQRLKDLDVNVDSNKAHD